MLYVQKKFYVLVSKHKITIFSAFKNKDLFISQNTILYVEKTYSDTLENKMSLCDTRVFI